MPSASQRLCFVLLCALGGCSSLPIALPATGLGAPAPEVELTDARTGEAVELAAYRGRTVILNVWATWCGPCIVERETLHSVYERHHEKAGLEIVSISLDRSAAVVEQFREEKWPMPWRHVLGKSEASEAHIAALFGKDKKLPRMILVDADGTIVAEADELTYDTVEEAVNIMTAK